MVSHEAKNWKRNAKKWHQKTETGGSAEILAVPPSVWSFETAAMSFKTFRENRQTHVTTKINSA